MYHWHSCTDLVSTGDCRSHILNQGCPTYVTRCHIPVGCTSRAEYCKSQKLQAAPHCTIHTTPQNCTCKGASFTAPHTQVPWPHSAPQLQARCYTAPHGQPKPYAFPALRATLSHPPVPCKKSGNPEREQDPGAGNERCSSWVGAQKPQKLTPHRLHMAFRPLVGQRCFKPQKLSLHWNNQALPTQLILLLKKIGSQHSSRDVRDRKWPIRRTKFNYSLKMNMLVHL